MAPAVENADLAGRVDGAHESVSTQTEKKQNLVKIDKVGKKTAKEKTEGPKVSDNKVRFFACDSALADSCIYIFLLHYIDRCFFSFGYRREA